MLGHKIRILKLPSKRNQDGYKTKMALENQGHFNYYLYVLLRVFQLISKQELIV